MFSVVSFEGLDPFLAAIEGLKTESCLDARSPFEIKERSEALPDDQGLVPLHAALTSGAVVAIGITRPGFSQEWKGIIEKLVPSMGFINVMVPDFHFHLRAGVIGQWKRASNEDGITLDAYDQNGAPLGLTCHRHPLQHLTSWNRLFDCTRAPIVKIPAARPAAGICSSARERV
jgi:hypothetical protein